MPTATITDAAAALGFRSRSTLQRLKRDGLLRDYLLPPDAAGRQLIELEPRGLPSLRQYVAAVVQGRRNGHANPERVRPDRRFEGLAGCLTDALEPINGPRLTGRDAAALADAMPEAVALTLGIEGLQRLADAVAAELAALTPPEPEPEPKDAGAFWRDYGTYDPEAEPLGESEFWQEVAAMATAMMGSDTPLTGPEALNLRIFLEDAMEDVAAGCRWDADRWDIASARSLLEDWDGCPSEFAELQRLADGGRLPPDLQAQALELLAQGPAPEPLPVVVTD